MATLLELLRTPDVTLAAIAERCDALDPEARGHECRELGEKELSRLYDVAAAGGPATIEELMAGAKDGDVLRYLGKNSLLAPISHFEKHFRRFEGEVVGINVGKAWMSFFGGPGYFTCVDRLDGEHERELLFDYTRVPASTPPGWPKVKPNEG